MDPITLRRYPGGAAHASARQPMRGVVKVAENDARSSDERLDSQLRLLLSCGGDERIWPDPTTGRNKYGVPLSPAPDEIWLSSSTASAITPPAYREVSLILRRLITTNRADRLAIEEWFDSIRNRLLHLFGVPGATAVLSASGTEAELLAVAVARSLSTRPLTNIVVAPDETGSGVFSAAGGKHFLASTALAGPVIAGSLLSGLETTPIHVQSVEIRDSFGHPRPSAEVDQEVGCKVLEALQKGHHVLVHVLDASKTGLTGLTRRAAEALSTCAPDRVAIVVDACQLRCSAAQIQADLNRGYMVLLTGSKFAGGPPFSGALLLPSPLVGGMQLRLLPEGLASYSAYHDWPAKLRPMLALPFNTLANLGMGLRWEAALFELENFAAIAPMTSAAIVETFVREVAVRVESVDWLVQLDGDFDFYSPPTIVPVVAATRGGLAEAAFIHRALRSPLPAADTNDKICHLGQPVRMGNRAALRFCASAPMICKIAQEVSEGISLEAAFAPVRKDLDAVFRKWEALNRQ
jgi:hypothetical protein